MAHFLAALGVAWVVALGGLAHADAAVISPVDLHSLLDAARREVERGGGGAQLGLLTRRARLSGLLPRVRLGLRRGQQYDLYRDLTFDTGNSRSSADEELTIDASAVFELDRLVFAPAQVPLARLQRAARAEAEERVREVIALVFSLEKRWQEHRSAAEVDPELELTIAELVVLIDTLTGGEFEPLWQRALAAQRQRDAAPAPVPPSVPKL